ncbi:LPXTG cell wall anchor domain-containing protein [Streptomyces sp. NPDC047079]|uniref:LPXTG cell wall anchor domain-containing protein n=1 Tax=Streptomyces sp. NPDC047079 TaxID=3154607 RepID=UPI00340428B2
MKLRHAIATAVASAAMAPLALLSAPAAFAEDPSPSASATETVTSESPTSPAPDTTTPPADSGSSASASSAPASSAPASSAPSVTASVTPSRSQSQTPSSGPTDPSGGWSPDQCEDFNLDENLKVTVKGLPSKIVAGSGWHGFTFSVRNNSDTDLKNVWVSTFTEYADDVDASLAFDLAQLQYKDPETGKWTDAYQDGDGDTVLSGTFVGVIDAIDKGATVDMDLRVRISSKAPAGSSFALSSAIYAGKGTACNGNGDSYDFTVLAAGTKPTDNGDAKPNGDKPTKPTTDMKPQGGSEQLPVTGSLASTGSSSTLPVIALVGGVAVVAGAGAVFAVRRRKSGGQAA